MNDLPVLLLQDAVGAIFTLAAGVLLYLVQRRLNAARRAVQHAQAAAGDAQAAAAVANTANSLDGAGAHSYLLSVHSHVEQLRLADSSALARYLIQEARLNQLERAAPRPKGKHRGEAQNEG